MRWMALLLLCGCAGAVRAPAETHLRSTPVAACTVAFSPLFKGQFRGGFALTWPEWSGFGGWSDLIVSADGASALAVSDDGHYMQVTLTHGDGRLTGIADARTGALPGCPDKLRCDVESLTRRADGTLWVGIERQLTTSDAIWAFAAGDPPFQQAPTAISVPAGLDKMPINAGLEAMTTLPDDSVLALAEGPEPVKTPVPMWRWRHNVWEPLRYPATANYRPVALAPLPAGTRLGDVLVLERKWLPATHEAGTRIVAARLPTEGKDVTAQEVLRLLPDQCPIDNFEGLAVRRVDGALWLYLLSDDNQSAKQKTLFYAFSLD